MPEVRTVFREAPFAVTDAEAQVLRQQGLLREPPPAAALHVPFAVAWGSPEAAVEQVPAAAQDEPMPEPPSEPEQAVPAEEPAAATRKPKAAGKTPKESA